MHASLVIETGQDPGRRYPLGPGQRLVLGRGDDVDVPVLDDQASRNHVAVALTPDGLTVTDLGSKNGTLLDGQPLPPNTPRTVTNGVLSIGAHRIRVQVAGAAPVTRIRDEYEKLAELGRGAAGLVFAARHRATGRLVAIKTLLDKVEASRPRDRFMREGRVRIDSPHVVAIHDLRVESDTLYIVMELVEGESLHACLQRAGRLTLPEALRVGEHVALGLHAAHSAGVIHRDVKPANILLTRDALAKLTDFGIAKLRATTSSLTASGTGLGTMAYVAPEQAEDAKRVSPASDLYSLGATLYHCLTGQPPFLPGPDLISQLFDNDPKPVKRLRPDCPTKLSRLVGRLLEKHPDDRPTDAAAVARTLAGLAREVQK